MGIRRQDHDTRTPRQDMVQQGGPFIRGASPRHEVVCGCYGVLVTRVRPRHVREEEEWKVKLHLGAPKPTSVQGLVEVVQLGPGGVP